jgi:hypothetical protein
MQIKQKSAWKNSKVYHIYVFRCTVITALCIEK